MELSGYPLLEWQMGAMRKAGISDILVVRGYRGEMIIGNFKVCDNPDWDQTNMVASLMCAQKWLEDDICIVSYSDIVYDFHAVSLLGESQGDLSLLYDINWLTLWQKRFVDPRCDAESFSVDDNCNIRDIGRKNVSLTEIQGQYMGLLKFTPTSFRWIDDLLTNNEGFREKFDMTTLLSNLIQAGYSIKGVPWEGGWCEVDNVKDLHLAESMVDAKELSFP